MSCFPVASGEDTDIFSTVANHRNQIQTFPRRIFDPRRPNRKVTSEEQEEWLIQYDPLIPDDPRRIISHNYEVRQLYNICLGCL